MFFCREKVFTHIRETGLVQKLRSKAAPQAKIARLYDLLPFSVGWWRFGSCVVVVIFLVTIMVIFMVLLVFGWMVLASIVVVIPFSDFKKILLEYFWILLGYFWDTFGTLLGYFWYTFEILLGYFWDTSGILLDTLMIICGYFWDTFRILLAYLWVIFGVLLGYLWSTCGTHVLILFGCFVDPF